MTVGGIVASNLHTSLRIIEHIQNTPGFFRLQQPAYAFPITDPISPVVPDSPSPEDKLL